MEEDRSRSEDDNTSEMEASDAEGVWSPDIEQSFQEALILYPPCGRRKIILSEEGKMYGRNELIARYIKMRTSKTRTRKQVSSHIQVLARKKSREYQSKIKDHTAKEKVMQVMSTMSSAQIVSAMTYPNRPLPGMGHGPVVSPYSNGSLWQPGLMPNSSHQDIKPCIGNSSFYDRSSILTQSNSNNSLSYDGRSVASNKLRLIDFVSFVTNHREPEAKHVFVEIGPANGTDAVLETIDIRQFYDKFPEKNGGLRDLCERGPTNAFFLVKFWADINCADMDTSSFYGFSSTYESSENMPVQCSNKACSYGKQVVELETEVHGALEGGRYVYRIQRSQMCEYMMNFILKLKDLPDRYSMNTVLENFTILQVVSNQDTHETLLCLAFMFEVSNTDHGGNSAHIYRLVKD